jgi:hypothetical protein
VMIQRLENEISMLLCKLEKVFPPRVFNPMQYLVIHLPNELKWVVLFNIGGCIALKDSSYILNQSLAIGQGVKGEM